MSNRPESTVPGADLSSLIPGDVSEAVLALRPLAVFAYAGVDGQRQTQIHFRVELASAAAKRDLLCAAFPIALDGSVIGPTRCSWVYSRRVGAPYRYFPNMPAGRSVVALEPFRSDDAFDLLVLAVREWQGNLGPGDIEVMSCLCSAPLGISSVNVPVFSPATPLTVPEAPAAPADESTVVSASAGKRPVDEPGDIAPLGKGVPPRKGVGQPDLHDVDPLLVEEFAARRRRNERPDDAIAAGDAETRDAQQA